MPRRDSKPEIDVPRKARFATDREGERATGWVVGLSVAGAELESLSPPPIGSSVVLWVTLLEGDGLLEVHGRVQWATPTRFAVQFGPLGVRETGAIVRASSRPPPVP